MLISVFPLSVCTRIQAQTQKHLFRAAERGYLEEAKKCITEKANINTGDSILVRKPVSHTVRCRESIKLIWKFFT
jgi:hypothetical protein